MMQPAAGIVDTNVVIHRAGISVDHLPARMAVTAVTLAELAAGIHLVSGAPDADAERARRLEALQWVESEFDPFPFDVIAARMYGRVVAAVRGTGRTPRRRVADLMIASIAGAVGLPLFTTNADDLRGLDGLVVVLPVPRPKDG